ncbi:6-phosphogluconolactonase [Candidatus Woesearchaeota archaeon]|nr:6-phosphogluconolactonase [Candidatus Woesearchaeota archaeon]
MGLEVVIAQDFEDMSEEAANIIIPKIREATIYEQVEFNVGLATGSSPIGLYKRIIERQKEFDATRVASWNLDEYIGLPGETLTERIIHPQSYAFFMIQNLFGRLSPPFAKTHIPRGAEIDQRKLVDALKEGIDRGYVHLEGNDKGKAVVVLPSCNDKYLRWIRDELLDSYLHSIRDAGGIDYWIVGVGENGHIGFHESGIPLHHQILLVKLDDNTIYNAVKDGHFPNREDAPQYAISMGAGGIFGHSRNILLLASGGRKAECISKSLLGQATSEVPISGLYTYAQNGGNVTYVLDEDAAKGILGRDALLNKKGIAIKDLRLKYA